MRYPPQFLDRLRQHYRLSEIIGTRIAIKRAGREYHALCPFHNEKSPSFTINDEKGFYHCFGCGKHGDVIGFLKDYENLSYTQAVESLARQAGISLPQVNAGLQRHIDQSEKLYRVMEQAADWFTLQLRQIGGSDARDYLLKRGLKDETLREFRLGFAPRQRSGLKDALLQRGVTEAEMIAAGLLVRAEEGGATYDKFRGRIVFPITDSSGRVIAFGGRLTDPEAKGPKYLNSPDTLLFKKSYNLYHMDVARRAAGKAGTILVAEGYMDVIALAQAGLEHTVAPLGTAITREQLGMLWQVTDEPVLCLDGDTAGWRAMERALEVALPLLAPGKSLSFVRMPPGEDPDSLMLKHGAGAMDKLLAQKQPLIDVLWQKYVGGKPVSTPEQIAGAEEEIKKAVERIENVPVRDHYRQAIKQRIWGMRRYTAPPSASGSAPRRGERSAKPPVASGLNKTRPALLSMDQQRQFSREACYRSLLTLLSYYPALLDAAQEEQLVGLTLSDPALEHFREALLMMPEDTDALARAQVQAHLERTLGEKRYAECLRKGAVELPRPLVTMEEELGLPAAAERLDDIQRRLEVLALEEELERAQTALGLETTDQNRERFEALHRRMQEVRNSQGYFPDTAE